MRVHVRIRMNTVIKNSLDRNLRYISNHVFVFDLLGWLTSVSSGLDQEDIGTLHPRRDSNPGQNFGGLVSESELRRTSSGNDQCQKNEIVFNPASHQIITITSWRTEVIADPLIVHLLRPPWIDN